MASPPVLTLPPDLKSSFKTLINGFISAYGQEPDFITRAPGRVNIIGEHIDYCGYAVLPMALEQHILMAAKKDSSKDIKLSNLNPKFPYYTCDISNFKICKEKPQWYNYALCGVLGVLQHFKLDEPVGLSLFVDGTIPPSAGLSSSSALVCAAALATLHANGLKMSKKDLASLCAHSERFIGTEGGGMDQAIAFLAEAGTAEVIEFNPIQTHEVHLPKGAAFVIANSCADINKAATSDFNTRVVECRLAAQILSKQNGLNWEKSCKLLDVQNALKLSLPEMSALVKKTFHPEPYNRKEIREILEITDEELLERSLSANTKHLESFNLFQRAFHVFTEANRVWEFKKICEEAPKDVLQKLGDLMNNSHTSCRDLYNCSHPNLDELVAVSTKAGALGSRLTGAGWGGCSVSLVPTERVNEFLTEVKKNYYEKNKNRIAFNATSIFPTQPSNGAAIYLL